MRGHPRTPETTYTHPRTGHRRCRTCKAERRRTGRPPGRRPGPQARPVDLSWFTIPELAAVDRTDDSWRDHANCLTSNPSPEHTDRWFTGRGANKRLAEAAAICEQCPVRLECLGFGLWEKFGMFGGVSEKVRRRLRKAVNTYLETTEEAA